MFVGDLTVRRKEEFSEELLYLLVYFGLLEKKTCSSADIKEDHKNVEKFIDDLELQRA